jgi:hypothetical protein
LVTAKGQLIIVLATLPQFRMLLRSQIGFGRLPAIADAGMVPVVRRSGANMARFANRIETHRCYLREE